MEENSIDRDRIVDNHLVPDEYFCPICQCLLWKPRSCSSCQNLFCQKCIETWLKNDTNVKRCPFRCETYEDRRCPPYIHSLLSRLNIHCRNSSFGCTQILPYDLLEHHENIQCKYLSKQCLECNKLVLVSNFDQHQQTAGLCISSPIKCTICQNFFEKHLFREHFSQCFYKKLFELNRRTTEEETEQATLDHQLDWFETITNTIRLVEQQRQTARFPTSLKGIDEVIRAREENCGDLKHILIMLKFIVINWSKIPYFIFTLAIVGLVNIGIRLHAAYIIFSYWTWNNIHFTSYLIILLNCLLTYGTSILFHLISDQTIIFSLGTFIFLWGCTCRALLEIFEVDPYFNRPFLNIVRCCLGIFIMKIILLLFRLSYWYLPIYVIATVITSINFIWGFKLYRAHAIVIARPNNQQLMPV